MAGSKRKKRSRSPRVPRTRSVRALRLLALGVVVFAGVLYYQPLTSYFQRRDALAQRSKEVAVLRAQKRELERRFDASQSPEALAREARRLGLIKEGEHLFIVKGIDAWKRAHGATIGEGDR
jgi:cell division protein FtsB